VTRHGTGLLMVGLALLVVAATAGRPAVALLGGPVALAGAGLLWRRRTPTERPWAPSPTTDRPTRPRPTGRRSVVVALGRFEGRELARSPWIAVGLGLGVLMALDFAYLSPDPLDLAEVFVSLPFLAHPLVGMAVLASHRSAGRAERDRVTELFAATPTSEADRRAGVLRAAPVAVAGLAGFFAAYLAGAVLSDAGAPGPAGPAVPILLSGLLLGAGGVALGALLARAWVQPVVPVAALVAVGLLSPRLADSAGGTYSPRLLLSTLPPVGEDVTVLTASQEWLHTGWLLVLVTATFVAAGVSRRVLRPSGVRSPHDGVEPHRLAGLG